MEDKKIYYRVNFDMYIENIEVVKIIHDENSKYFDRVYFSKIDLADAFQEYGGSFVQSLWTALINADCINADKLIKTFENYVIQYAFDFIQRDQKNDEISKWSVEVKK